jgi:hypothetical protein
MICGHIVNFTASFFVPAFPTIASPFSMYSVKHFSGEYKTAACRPSLELKKTKAVNDLP